MTPSEDGHTHFILAIATGKLVNYFTVCVSPLFVLLQVTVFRPCLSLSVSLSLSPSLLQLCPNQKGFPGMETTHTNTDSSWSLDNVEKDCTGYYYHGHQCSPLWAGWWLQRANILKVRITSTAVPPAWARALGGQIVIGWSKGAWNPGVNRLRMQSQVSTSASLLWLTK